TVRLHASASAAHKKAPAARRKVKAIVRVANVRRSTGGRTCWPARGAACAWDQRRCAGRGTGSLHKIRARNRNGKRSSACAEDRVKSEGVKNFLSLQGELRKGMGLQGMGLRLRKTALGKP